MGKFIKLIVTLLAVPMVFISCNAVQDGGYNLLGENSSGGSSLSDKILTKINIYTVNFSVNDDGLLIPGDALYKWSFGDGTTGEGRTPVHTYQGAGTYDVSVEITGTASDGTPVNYNFHTSVVLEKKSIEASNSYLYAEKNKENPLRYSFFTPLEFSGIAPENVIYKWQYDITSSTSPVISKSNVASYTYDKFGKKYTAQVVAETTTGLKSTATVDINIPNPQINLICSSQGLTVTCYPELSLDGEEVNIPMSFEWNCGNDESYTKTNGAEPKTCVYNENDGKEQTIKVTGTSNNLENPITGEETVSISTILNVGKLACELGGSADHLTWNCYIYTTLKDNTAQGSLKYRWNFGDVNSSWTDWEEAPAGYNSKTYTYQQYRTNESPSYNVEVEVLYEGDNNYGEQGKSSTTITIDAPAVTINESAESGNNFKRTFTAVWPDYTPKGSVEYIWDFGDGNRKQGDSIISHTYTKNGEYEVAVSVKSTENVFPEGFIETAKLNLKIDDKLNVPSGENAIIKTQHEDNPLKWDFKIDGVTSTSGEIVYQWKKDGVEIPGANGKELKNVELDKFGKPYSISVDISIKGTNITETRTTSVMVEPPVVEIILPDNIVAGKEAVFKNTIKYNNKDAKGMLKNIQYSWIIDGDNSQKTETARKTWKEEGEDKVANLTVTASNVEGEMAAPQKMFSVLPGQKFSNIIAQCATPEPNFDTIRHICSGYAIDQNGNKLENINPEKYRFVWTAAGGIDSNGKVHYDGGSAEIILNWPDEKRANKIGDEAKKSFNVWLAVYDTEEGNRKVWNGGTTLTVKRNIGYKASVRNTNNGKGENIKNIIDITDITGPDNAEYKWVHQLNTRKNGISNSSVDKPFKTGKVKELDFTQEANKVGFIGKVSYNPFNGANGVALEVSGEGLSAPVRIWGLDVADNDYQMFGPSINWCTGSNIIRALQYEVGARNQQPGFDWGDTGNGPGNLIYLWQNGGIYTDAKVSKEVGDFAKITVLTGAARSLANVNLHVDENILTTAYEIRLSSEGTNSIGNSLAFFFGQDYQDRYKGNLETSLEVKDTTNGYYGKWYTYGTCSTPYELNKTY